MPDVRVREHQPRLVGHACADRLAGVACRELRLDHSERALVYARACVTLAGAEHVPGNHGRHLLMDPSGGGDDEVVARRELFDARAERGHRYVEERRHDGPLQGEPDDLAAAGRPVRGEPEDRRQVVAQRVRLLRWKAQRVVQEALGEALDEDVGLPARIDDLVEDGR